MGILSIAQACTKYIRCRLAGPLLIPMLPQLQRGNDLFTAPSAEKFVPAFCKIGRTRALAVQTSVM